MSPERQYRALISVPITATSDIEAWERGAEYACALLHPGSTCIAGHMELLGECEDPDASNITRLTYVDPGFLRVNFPADRQPT